MPFRLWSVFPLDCAGKDGVGCERLAFRHFCCYNDQRCFTRAIMVDAIVVEMYEFHACDVDILGLRKDESGPPQIQNRTTQGCICSNK